MKIRIPVAWIEYKRGELVVEVPEEENVKNIVEEIEATGVDSAAFCDFKYSTNLIVDEKNIEYDNYHIIDKNNIIIEK